MPSAAVERRLHNVLLLLALLLCLLRFAYLRADFPNHSPWMIDQAKFTDEGWWANAAVRHFLIGHWQVAGDYNPAAAVPVWPVLLTMVFHFTGVSFVAARAVNVFFSISTVVLVYLLVRRYASETAAAVAALLLAASPFAFAFSRLATLDTMVNFEFCLLLWIASYANPRRIWPSILLGILIPILLLTKTTAVVLVPAVVWLLWMGTKKRLLLSTLLVGTVAGAGIGVYLSLVTVRGSTPFCIRPRWPCFCCRWFGCGSFGETRCSPHPGSLLRAKPSISFAARMIMPPDISSPCWCR
jgi:4-amino-4-deoxy-L-arabinose transferase-like glycosyltransferase